MRWPSKIPAGRVSNEIVHALDMFATLANVAGADVPDDRVIDSVDQLEFLTGKQDKSNRDGFMVYVGSDLFGIKWRNWKMMFKEVERGTDEKRTFDFPRFFNLYSDPKEEYPLTKATAGHFWVRWPMGEILTKHGASLQKGASDQAQGLLIRIRLQAGDKRRPLRYCPIVPVRWLELNDRICWHRRHSPLGVQRLKRVGFCRSLLIGLIRCAEQLCRDAIGGNRPQLVVPGGSPCIPSRQASQI